MKKVVLMLALVVLLGVQMQAMGTVVFVNANTSNTVGYNASTGNDSTDWWTTSSYTGDDKWRYRPEFGMAEGASLPATPDGIIPAGGLYQSIDSGQSGKNARTLKTTISGLDAGTVYEIFAYLWDDQYNSGWSIRAALTQAGLADNVYNQYAAAGDISQVAKDSAGRKMYQVSLGTVTGVTSQLVWIDDLPTNDSNNRTWYDGVGYAVVPEPATMALLGLGGLLLRRKR